MTRRRLFAGLAAASVVAIGKPGIVRAVGSRQFLSAPLVRQAAPGPATDMQAIYDDLQLNYDLGGQPVTIKAASGLYTRGFYADGGLVGQFSPNQLQIIGNITNPAACLVQPTSSADCFALAYGASFTLSGFAGDLLNCVPGQGIITVGQNAVLTLGRTGDACAFLFGNHNPSAGNQYNDVTVNSGGHLDVNPGKLIFGASQNAQKQCMFDIALSGRLSFSTNGNPALLTLQANSNPTYIAGIFRLDTGSYGVLGANYQGLVHGQQWWVDGFSALVTYSPYGVMFGDQAGYTGQFGQVRLQ